MNLKELKIEAQLLCNKSIDTKEYIKYLKEAMDNIYIFPFSFQRKIESYNENICINKKYYKALAFYIAYKERIKYHTLNDKKAKQLYFLFIKELNTNILPKKARE